MNNKTKEDEVFSKFYVNNLVRENAAFSRFYMFATEAKTTMALFYMYMVFMYLVLTWAAKAPVQTVDFAKGMQMFVMCVAIGLAQRIIIPRSNITVAKSILWCVVSLVVAIVPGLIFGWFRGFPLWCPLVFWGVLVVGLVFMVAHLQITLNGETRQLNEQLKKFQKTENAQKGETA